MGAFDLSYLGAHLVGDGRATELPIQETEVVGVGVQDHDRGRVDRGRSAQTPDQFSGLLFVFVVVIAGGGCDIQRRQAEQHAGVIG
ncbi:hypothetical protein [Nonomuraea sp. NPDC050643]|uniref:hypothetical protein n=1 Tax=Nonomuraea sp. NPDC050643 TaxID=3155660 RepID=UPI0033D2A5C2